MPLPFDLPSISAGFAALTPEARATAAQAGSAAAGALSAVLGREVEIRGRAVPGTGPERAASARVSIELPAVPATATLEVESSLVVALVDALAGGPGTVTGATALTPIEATVLELLTLVALDGVCSVAEVERALGPRLSRASDQPASALAIELEISAGPIAGRARLLVAAAGVRALRKHLAVDGLPPISLPASLRSGRTTLSTEELAALAPGDVLLLEPPGEPPDALVLPGGARATGRCEDGAFHVEEVTMVDRCPQLPVTLEVELARVDIPLAEIARLEPGVALPLGLDRRGLVTLRVGERAIARGELVDVDGAVGVRVLSVDMEMTP